MPCLSWADGLCRYIRAVSLRTGVKSARARLVRQTDLRHYEPQRIINGEWRSGDEGVRIADPSGEATGARHGQESVDGVIALRVRIVELRAMALERLDPWVDIVRDVHHECGRQIMGKQVIEDVGHGVGLPVEWERAEVREIDPVGDQIAGGLVIRMADSPAGRATPVWGQHQGGA